MTNQEHTNTIEQSAGRPICEAPSLTSLFFKQSVPSFIRGTFNALLTSKNFEKELAQTATELVPSMLALLKGSSVAHPEKVLLELVDEQLKQLDQLSSQNKAIQTQSQLNKQSKFALQITLWLEKLYLTDEATSEHLKGAACQDGAADQAHQLGSRPDSKVQDVWEKRQLKIVRKLRVQLRKTLQDLQILFDIKASAAEEDQDECMADANGPHYSDHQYSIQEQQSAGEQDFKTFTNFIRKVVIEPYSARLFDQINELAQELELADNLISELNQKGSSVLRKLARKPKTTSKIDRSGAATPCSAANKKVQKSIAVQTDCQPASQQSSSAQLRVPIQASTTMQVRRQSSQVSQDTLSVYQARNGAKQSGQSSRIQQILGGRVQRGLERQNQSSAADSNQINSIQKATATKRARINGPTTEILLVSDSSPQEIFPKASQDEIVAQTEQNRQNSNESYPERHLVDIMSSFGSVGSHSVSNLLAKRPLEQVSNVMAAQKTQSMGFREQANFKQVQGFQRQASAPGPGFLSQRNESANRFAQKSGTGAFGGRNGEANQFKMKKNVYSRKLGGTLTEPKITTRKPKLTNFSGAKIVSVGSTPGSSSINLSKKQCQSSQQSNSISKMMKARQQKSCAPIATSGQLSQATRHSNSQSSQPLGILPTHNASSTAATNKNQITTAVIRESRDDREILGL